MITMSHPGSIGVNLATSRKSRLTLFLTTAFFPTFLLTMKQNRLISKPLGIAFKTIKSLAQAFPFSKTAAICESLWSRSSLRILAESDYLFIQSVYGDQQVAFGSKPPARLVCSSSPENHACAFWGFSLADKSSSAFSFILKYVGYYTLI
jgi:hypothetical protein